VNHYDVISWGYEYFTEKLHGGHRIEAIDLLHLEPGQTVLDVPCGTGANFPLLETRIGDSGRIFGSDFSSGMLARARTKTTKAGWDNITLVEADARELTPELVGAPPVDALICMLGLSVVPDWELAFDRMYDLVAPGGRIVIMDLYLEGKPTSGIANKYYEVIAQAHSRRRFWEPLEQRSPDFETIEHSWFGGVAKIVAGTKPTG
jgi:ubiquinone/menaquinone biosynthesis C-methylase UbiE